MLHLFAFYGREPALVLQRLSGWGCMRRAEPYDVQEGFMVNRRPPSAPLYGCRALGKKSLPNASGLTIQTNKRNMIERNECGMAAKKVQRLAGGWSVCVLSMVVLCQNSTELLQRKEELATVGGGDPRSAHSVPFVRWHDMQSNETWKLWNE